MPKPQSLPAVGSNVRIGLISDTHGRLDSTVAACFAGVSHILHAGDVGPPWIPARLSEIAPVTVVAGNTDDPVHDYPESATVTLAGKRFLVTHIVDPQHPSETVERLILDAQPDVVVFGHTHRPFFQKVGPVLFVNPGSAGNARFRLPRTVAVLTLHGSEFQQELVDLGP